MLTITFAFWSYLTFLVPSIICALFALYHLLFNRTLRTALNNHSIIILLCLSLANELTNYPYILYYFQHGGSWYRPAALCSIWIFANWGLYATQNILFAWMTMERHILVFHVKWVSTKKRRFFVHYLPLLVVMLYCLIYHSLVVFFPPCQNFYDGLSPDMHCWFPCLLFDPVFFAYDTIAHQVVTVTLIMVFSLLLLVRVIWRKVRMQQPVQWSRQRKMTVQLLSISLLFFIFGFPPTVLYTMYLCGWYSVISGDFAEYVSFVTCFPTFFIPFICVSTLPELKTKVMKVLLIHRKLRPIVAVTRTTHTNSVRPAF